MEKQLQSKISELRDKEVVATEMQRLCSKMEKQLVQQVNLEKQRRSMNFCQTSQCVTFKQNNVSTGPQDPYQVQSINMAEKLLIFCVCIYIYIYIYIYIFSIYQVSGQQFSRVLIGSRNSEYPWLFTVLRTERKMARRFAKVSEEEIKTAFFYPSDLINTKTTIPLRVGEERWIYTSTLRVSVYIHHYSPPLRGIVV